MLCKKEKARKKKEDEKLTGREVKFNLWSQRELENDRYRFK